MKTPAGTFSLVSESIVFDVGPRMSISRLWVLISKCSRESLWTWPERINAEPLYARGQRHRTGDLGPRTLSGLHDLPGPQVQDAVIERPEYDPDLLSRCAGGDHMITRDD